MLHKNIRAGRVPITVRNQLHLMLRRWLIFGPKAALLYYGRRIIGLGNRNHTPRSENVVLPPTPDPQIEERFGLEAQPSLPPDTKWSILYERSSSRIFHAIMAKLPLKFDDYTFIDLGAGKGFALSLAAEFPFKQVIGVEFSEVMAGLAQKNIEQYDTANRKCHDVTCILGDAREFDFPSVPTVLYLYNPFQGSIMDKVISNLKKSLRECPREVWIIYTNPWEHRKFKRSREFEVVELNWDYAIYRTRKLS